MEIRIWLAAVDEVNATAARALLSSAELARAEGMPSALLRQRFLARRWMARAILGEATEQDPAQLALEARCERCGRLHPAARLPAGSGDVWWSASSSGGVASVAIAPWRVGLDLEQEGDRRRWERISARFYTEAEQRALGGSPARFIEFWTMKEAFLKAIGLGLAGGLRSLDCTTLSDPSHDWRTSPTHPGWRFAHLHPGPGLTAAVAVEGAPDSIELRSWDPETEGR